MLKIQNKTLILLIVLAMTGLFSFNYAVASELGGSGSILGQNIRVVQEENQQIDMSSIEFGHNPETQIYTGFRDIPDKNMTIYWKATGGFFKESGETSQSDRAEGFVSCNMGSSWDANWIVTPEKYVFECGDSVALGAHYENVYTSRCVGVGWYAPSVTTYYENTCWEVLPDPNDFGYDYWSTYDYVFYFFPLPDEEGEWTTLWFDDQSAVCSNEFVLVYNLADHSMCNGIDGNSDCIVDYSFSYTDYAAYCWLILDSFTLKTTNDVEFRWYDPSGSLYATTTNDIDNPVSYYDWAKVWAYIYIDGFDPSENCGDWHVNVYVKNCDDAWEFKFTEYFNISGCLAEERLIRLDPSSTTISEDCPTKNAAIYDTYDLPDKRMPRLDLPHKKGQLIIKIDPSLNANLRVTNGKANTGFAEIDDVFERNEVFGLKNVFKANQKSPLLRNTILIDFRDDIVDERQLIEELLRLDYVHYVEPNYQFEAVVEPNDAYYSTMWGLPQISMPAAWDITQGQAGVSIAIVDCGVDWQHPDLSANIWINSGETDGNGIDDDGNGFIDDIRGWDFVDGAPAVSGEDNNTEDNNPMDVQGHGTHCAGTASATTNNSAGIAGVGWNCSIMAIRAAWKNADGGASMYYADGVAAFEYAADNGASAINYSYTSYGAGITLSNAALYAYNRGVVVCVAAANDDINDPGTLGNLPTTLSVAATGTGDIKASFSNYGSWVDVSAPGVSIRSSLPGNSYAYWNGTSMATPHVAGLVGLISSVNSALTPAEIMDLIKTNSNNIDAQNPSYVGQLGDGRINAYASLTNAADAGVFNVCNDGNATLTVYEINPQASWLSASPQSFTVPPGGCQPVNIYIDWSLVGCSQTISSLQVECDGTNFSLLSEMVTVVPCQDFTISGYITEGGSGISGVILSGLPGTPVTNSQGYYSSLVSCGWNGTVFPSLNNCTFTPINRTYNNVTTNMDNQDYTIDCPDIYYLISGYVRDASQAGIDGVTLNGLPCSPLPVTDAAGYYECEVISGWSGTVTPFKDCYDFLPLNITYSNVTADFANQNYTGSSITYTISGYILDGTGGQTQDVTLSGFPCSPLPVTDANGYYECEVDCGWTGIVVPVKDNCSFVLPSIDYVDVSADMLNQNYVADCQSCTPCFTFTENTGETYPIVVHAASFDNLPIEVCDNIAVFDGDLCVGATVFNGTYPIAITAWVDDTQTSEVDGYICGNSLAFGFSRPSDCVEYICITSPLEYTTGDGTYCSGPYAEITAIDFCMEYCDTMFLNQGWNLVSSYIEPDKLDPLDMFDPIIGEVNILKDCAGSFCIPGLICSISAWDMSQAYWIHTDDATFVEICGDIVPYNTPISLGAGWNCIAYYPQCCLDAPTAIATVESLTNIIKDGVGGFYIPGLINAMDVICPFEGFSIHMASPATLVYPDCSPAAKESVPAKIERISPQHFVRTHITDAYHAIVIQEIVGMKSGDEVGIYCDDILIGGSVYSDGPLAISVWHDDSETEVKDGYIDGDEFEVRVWNSIENIVSNVEVNLLTGSMLLGESPYTVLSLNSNNTIEPYSYELSVNYPNPFNPVTNIDFSIPRSEHVEIAIHNILGQKVKKLIDDIYSSGQHSVQWNGRNENGQPVASGIYFYHIKAGDFEQTKKMTLMK